MLLLSSRQPFQTSWSPTFKRITYTPIRHGVWQINWTKVNISKFRPKVEKKADVRKLDRKSDGELSNVTCFNQLKQISIPRVNHWNSNEKNDWKFIICIRKVNIIFFCYFRGLGDLNLKGPLRPNIRKQFTCRFKNATEWIMFKRGVFKNIYGEGGKSKCVTVEDVTQYTCVYTCSVHISVSWRYDYPDWISERSPGRLLSYIGTPCKYEYINYSNGFLRSKIKETSFLCGE